MGKKVYSIQLLRFVFCIIIINYHFFSLFLRYNEVLPNYFCRGYLADEFFFMISGFFMAQTAMADGENLPGWTVSYILRRIRKIAIPYYLAWMLCFVGCRIADRIAGERLELVPNLINSIYELLFLEMFGFIKGEYSNSVAWFFSGMIISIAIIGPLLKKHREKYCLCFAPLSALLMLGMLSIHFDYLYYPHKVLPELPILKGMVRAFAEVNLGVFIYGIFIRSGNCKFSARNLIVLKIGTVALWLCIIAYMAYPFKSNSDEVSIQYDYIFTLLILIALTGTFVASSRAPVTAPMLLKAENVLGVCSFYIFFGQPVPYTLYKWFFALPLRASTKFILLHLMVWAFSGIIFLLHKVFQRQSLKKNSLNSTIRNS